jgi:hypothetical protein
MFKKFLVIASLLFSFSAFADIDTSNLTDAQKADLQAQAAKISAQNIAQKSNNVLDEASKDPSKAMSLAATWGQQAATAAEGFAKALGIAAHELNINVNEFLSTPAGKLTAILIIWKVAGIGLVHLLWGITTFFVTGIITRILFTDCLLLKLNLLRKRISGEVLRLQKEFVF